jgi:hypothetical protein
MAKDIEYVKIEMDEDSLADMPDSDKLKFLVKIAFANYKTLRAHGEILFGNGKTGLCQEITSICLNIKGLWAVLIGGGGIIIGVLVKIAVG